MQYNKDHCWSQEKLEELLADSQDQITRYYRGEAKVHVNLEQLIANVGAALVECQLNMGKYSPLDEFFGGLSWEVILLIEKKEKWNYELLAWEHYHKWLSTFKAHTHRPILRGIIAESAVESADSIPESVDSTTDFTIVGRLSISNMFNIFTPTQLAD